jgi:3-carboxy-cis,cis-muconate cycloisomerase
MTTAEPRRADTGLLSPGWADTGADDLLDDQACVRAMLAVEVALARAQAAAGVIPAAHADAIATAAGTARLDIDKLVAGVRATANPVVVFVSEFTSAVADVDPAAAESVHRGSTSQDVLDSALMVLTAATLRRVLGDLRRTATALDAMAGKYRTTPMAGRTLTQHAVPITFGLKAATWLQLVLDAVERVERVLADGLPASLGGAAGTLAAYQEYARLAGADAVDPLALAGPFAAELGLTEPLVPWHSVRTPMADVAAVLSFVTGALGRVAVDVEVLTRTEIGEVSEASAEGRGASSAMPQKRNPVFATMIATAARQVPAYTLVLHQSMVVEDERSGGGWHAEWQPLRDSLRLTAGAARNAVDLTEGLTAFPERMADNLALTGGAVVSERTNAVLAPRVGKRAAKALLATASATAAETGRPLPTVLVELAERDGHELDSDELTELLRPADYTGTAEVLVDRVRDRWRTLSRA